MTHMDTPEAFGLANRLLCNLGLERVLDIGSSFRPQGIIAAKRHVCADPCAEALAAIPGKETWNLDAKAALNKAGVWEFDAIVMLDVIEHMEKEDGREVLELAIAKDPRVIVIFTPWGFVPQEPHEPGGELQRHRSGWIPENFVGRWIFIHCAHLQGLDPMHGRTDPVRAFFAIWLRA